MLDIVTFGSEILGRKAEPVTEIDDGIRTLATDMLERGASIYSIQAILGHAYASHMFSVAASQRGPRVSSISISYFIAFSFQKSQTQGLPS